MFNRIVIGRVLLSLAVAVSCALGVDAIAKNSNHHNGHNALEAQLQKTGKHQNKDGRHQVGKHGKHDIFAHVKNNKVVNMTAGEQPGRKVKSNKKMAELDYIKVASNGEIQIAQGEVYYGYCFDYQFDDGVDEHCYWYTADDVLVDDTWVWYTV